MPTRDLKSILNTLPDPVLLLDGESRIVVANDSARDQFGGDWQGQYFSRAIREPSALSAVERVLSGESAAEVVVRREIPVRSNLKIRVVGLGAPTKDGTKAVVTVTDISHILEAEQMRSDFVANVSHELRSPLTSLSGIVETLKQAAKDDPAARDRFLEIMEREAARMNRLIDDLLSLSHVEVNAHIRPTKPVDLVSLLKQVVTTIDSRRDGVASAITLDLPPAAVWITGDEDELTQVFHNLVENAQKYGGKDAPITLTLQQLIQAPGFQTPVVSVAVKDQGPGIPAQHIPRLTERFYRVDAGRSRDRGGTGLGLAIVKHIVNRHRGRLLIESQPGVGSTFTVHLPRTR
jgi:two-component system, OmpR family, phosphate regulon sensor histidine kinase PhoR